MKDMKRGYRIYVGWKTKGVTFSYDDGVCQDRRLVDMFNYYHVKATFNLNSGMQTYASHYDLVM